MPGKRLLGIALAVACFPAIVPLHGQAPSAGRPDRVRGRDAASRRIIVKFQPSATPSDIAQIERLIDADLNVGIGGIRARVLHSRSRHTAELEAMLAALPQLEYVEPDWVVHSTTIPNDLLFPDQWALRNVGQSVVGRAPGTPGADIHAAAAWDLTTGSREVVIGIVDTGLDYTHPDIAANVWTAPADFSFVIGDRIFTCPAGTHGFHAVGSALLCDPHDIHEIWHGTHVAGIAGADGNDLAGVAGVNWRSSLMALNFAPDGTGFESDAVNAIEFAIQTKLAFAGTPAGNLRVINASWGGGGGSTALAEEIRRAAANDILFVAAAANSASNLDASPFYPASFNLPNMVAVASTTNTDTLSSFSGYGRNTVHLGAPGEDIVSTLDGGTWGLASGTSVAAPMVSGAAALVLSRCPLNTIDLKALLINTVDPQPALAATTISGGRLNVDRALRTCTGQPPSNGTEVVIHARDIPPASIHGAWSVASDSTAADGVAIATADGGGSTLSNALASPADFVEIPFTAVAGVPYHMWLRLKAEADSKWNDSVFAQFSDALVAGHPAYSIGTTDGLVVNLEPCQNCGDSGWGWQDTSYWLQQPATVTFQNSGSHVLRIQVREDGVRFDEIVLSAAAYLRGRPGAARMDTTIVHVAGVNQPPTATLTSPARDSTFTGGSTIALVATASDDDGRVERVEFFANAALVGTASAAPYTVDWTNVPPGNYVLRAIAVDNLGANTTSVAVPVTVMLPNQQPGDIVLYARDFPTVTGRWLRVADETAAGGFRLATIDQGEFVQTPLANPADMVEVSFPASAGTPYHVWFRIAAEFGSGNNGSVFAQFSDAVIDRTPVYRIGTTDALVVARCCIASGWGWQDSSDLFQPGTIAFATSGMHTLRIQLRQDGAGFDQVVLSPASFLAAAPGAKTDDTTIVPKPAVDRALPPTVVIYANDIPASGIHGLWSEASDATAAAGIELATADAGGGNLRAPLATPTDYVDATFAAAAGRPYTFWIRLKASNNNKYNDSIWVQFSDAQANGSPVYSIGSASGLLVNLATDATATSLNGWGWQNAAYWLSQPTTVTFATGGTHTIRIQIREDGVQFDQIVISPTTYLNAAPGPATNDHTIVPKSVAPPPPPPPPPPTPTEIVVYASDIPAAGLHGAWSRASDAAAAAGAKLSTPNNGVSNAAAPLASPVDYVEFAFNAPAGKAYTIWLRVKALNNDKYNDSVWLQFSDALAGGTAVYPINTTSALMVNLATDASAISLNAWGWQNTAYWLSQATTMTFATSGPHTLRIQTREDGVQIDQIVLSPSKYLNAPPGGPTNDTTIVAK